MDQDLNGISEEECIVETPPNKSRKKKTRPETWKRNIERKARHRPKGFPKMPTCDHRGKSGYKCSQLSMQDIRKIHFKYYKDADLQSKKNFILQHVSVSSAKRSRLPEGSNSRRKVSPTFFLPKQRQDNKENVKVCRSAFLTILQESRNRIQKLCHKYLELGITPPETRGGPRKQVIYEKKRDAVKEFIKTFKPIQKHYSMGRKNNTIRQYLPSELSVNKMWKMYMEANPSKDLQVQYEFFRNTFNENFNIGFDAPYTDKCSTCTRLEYQIANENDNNKKEDLNIEFKGHKIRAERFYEILRKKNDDELVISYDCQKNLVLPKIPDQAAYYKSQLYLYNFTICEGVSTSPQNKTNTFAYLWTENKSKTRKLVMVQGKPFYGFECGEPKSLVKKGKTFSNARIPEVPRGVPIKLAKVNDVRSLLVLHYGEQWQDDPKLNFYTEVFLQLDSPQPDEGTDEEDILHDLEINPEDDHEVVA
uniref:Uncharacterized protein n=1 Tax=Timema poppense TaxID=170557 RepID=A0A7R9CUH9_TIMPO|nr:unnamed protein product [Timema poppensis]